MLHALLCWPFELPPLNELYRGKLVLSIILIPFEIFRCSVYMFIRSRRCVTFKNGCFPMLAFWVSSLNEFYTGKLVRSIMLLPFEIFLCKLIYIYIRSRQCVTYKSGCSPLLPFRVISLESTLEWKACTLSNSYTLRYFDDIWIIYWYVTYKKLLPLLPFWVISLESTL